MNKLFSKAWMEAYAQDWNRDEDMARALADAHFDGVIGYGYIGEDKPRGVVHVVNGNVVYAGAHNAEALDWDLRARLEDWEDWLTKGFGIAKLGISVSAGKLKFLKGDYRRMVRNPALAGPFLRNFEVMARVHTEFSQ